MENSAGFISNLPMISMNPDEDSNLSFGLQNSENTSDMLINFNMGHQPIFDMNETIRENQVLISKEKENEHSKIEIASKKLRKEEKKWSPKLGILKKRKRKSWDKEKSGLYNPDSTPNKKSTENKSKRQKRKEIFENGRDFKSELGKMLNISLKVWNDLKKKEEEKISNDHSVALKWLNLREMNNKTTNLQIYLKNNASQDSKFIKSWEAIDKSTSKNKSKPSTNKKVCFLSNSNPESKWIKEQHDLNLSSIKDINMFLRLKTGKIHEITKIKLDEEKKVYAVINWSSNHRPEAIESIKVDIDILKLLCPVMLWNYYQNLLHPKEE